MSDIRKTPYTRHSPNHVTVGEVRELAADFVDSAKSGQLRFRREVEQAVCLLRGCGFTVIEPEGGWSP